MKKQVLSFALAFSALAAHAQSVGIGTVTPDASAQLDVVASNKGLLMPRVAIRSVNDATTIVSPATGLMIYNNGAFMAAGQGFYFNSGTPAAPVWMKLNTVIGNTAPTPGQTIIWNGTTYVPGNPVVASTPLSGAGTTASPLAIDVNAPVYNSSKIQSTAVSATTPTAGQVLQFDAITNSYVPRTMSGDNWGTQSAVVTAATMTGNGTATSPLNVKNGDAIWNANQINSNPVVGTFTAGQLITYDGTKFVPGNVVTGGLLTGNGTALSPISFSGVSTATSTTSNTPLSGNGSAGSPLTLNTNLPVYNAGSIQGKNVSSTTPTTGQVLRYDGASYAPSTLMDTWGTQSAAVNSTTLTGNGTASNPLSAKNGDAIWNANKINNIAISGAPTTGQTLIFDGTNYVPGTAGNDNWGTQTIVNANGSPISGSGTASSPLTINTGAAVYNANKINSTTITGTPTTIGQAIVFDGTNYVPGTPAVAVNNTTISGNGTTNNPLNVKNGDAIWNANTIQSKSIDLSGLSNGQTLVWNSASNKFVAATAPGDNWGTQSAAVSSTTMTGNGTASSPLAAKNGDAIWNANKINNIAISGTPSNGQTLIFNGTNYVPGNAAADNWGTQSVVVNSTTLSGNGTATSPLTAKNGDAIWNANKINNISITGTPSNGQTLVFNGTNYAPVSMIDSTTASNGLKMVGNDVQLGGSALSSNTDISLNSKNFTLSGSGKVGIGTSSPSSTLHVVASADPVRVEGLQQISASATFKPLVVDGNGVVKTATSINKVYSMACNGTQDLNTYNFNNGVASRLTFIPTDIDVNTGGIFTFNDANDDVTVSESGVYAIEGYSGYVSNDDATNGSTNNNITENWGQGINLTVNINGQIKDGTRFIYTRNMGHVAVTSSNGVNFIATIYTKTIVNLNAGDKISLQLQKVLGNDSRDPKIMVPTGLTEAKKMMITKM